jgi:hypothetical protein
MRQIHLLNAEHVPFDWSFKKPAIYLALAAALILFGNVLLPLLGHVVIVCLEVMELLFENFLEAVFGIELHLAQMITAWTGFILFSVLLIELLKRIMATMHRFKVKAQILRNRII